MNRKLWQSIEWALLALGVIFCFAHWSNSIVYWLAALVLVLSLVLDRWRVPFPHYGFTSATPAVLLAGAYQEGLGVGVPALGILLTGLLRQRLSSDLLPLALSLAAFATGHLSVLQTSFLYALASLCLPLLKSRVAPRLSGVLTWRTWNFHLLSAGLASATAWVNEPSFFLLQALTIASAMGLVRSQRGMNLESAYKQEARQLRAEQMKDYLSLIDALGYSLHNQAEPKQVLQKVASVMVTSSKAENYALMERDGPRWRVVKQKGTGEKKAVEKFQQIQSELPSDSKPLKLKKGWLGESAALILPWEGEGAIYLARQTEALENVSLLERLARLGAAALRTAHEKSQRRELGDYKGELERLYGELKEAHRELEESQSELVQAKKLAAVGQLAAGVAHELNSPFQAIAVHLDLVKTSLEDPDDLECADTIAEALERCRVIVKELLHFSRRPGKSPETLDLKRVLKSALTTTGLKLPLQCEGLAVKGHEHELVSLFTNLLNNAKDAVAEAGLRGNTEDNIRIQVDSNQTSVRISIEDRGCGMPDEVRERVFEPFYTTKEVGSGTGLGLYMVYTYVVNAGGEIEVQSAPGKGTKFLVSLPAA